MYRNFAGIQARSSGGERYLDAVEVWGSNTHVPTIDINSPKESEVYIIDSTNILIKSN